MGKNKGFIGIGLIIAIILGIAVVSGGAYYLGKSGSIQEFKNPENVLTNNENQNIEQIDNSQNQVVKDNKITNSTVSSCTSDKGNIMTNEKALEIAKASSCNNIGNFNGEYSCNKNAGGLVDVYMEPINKPGCSFACRVSIDTGKTEEGWMCTGLLNPPTELHTATTELPEKYLDSQNWPPIVKTSGFAYSCKLSSGSGDVPTVVEEKIINGKKYCITSFIDAGAGSRFGEYTYTTPSTSGSGTKTTSFNLRWSSCGAYDKPESDQCQITVSTFLNNLDAVVDSLMFT